LQEDRSGEPGSEERIPKEPEEGQSQQTPAARDQPRADSPVPESGQPYGESRPGGEFPSTTGPVAATPPSQPAQPASGSIRGAEEVPGETGGEVMSSLPRTRPQRRSERRTPASGASGRAGGRARGSTAARGKRPARARTPAQTAAQPKSKAAPVRSTAPAAPAAKARPTASSRSRRAPRAPELAMSAAVQAAKIPVRTAVAVGRMTAGLISRGLRR
jgi:hypothetical protein